MIIYHGSENIICEPTIRGGRATGDYGKGFYCTESSDLAMEWACRKNKDGFANCYELDTDKLKVCDLGDEKYSLLNRIALLTMFRGYWQNGSLAEEAKVFLQENYLVDISGYDVVIGKRADNALYSFVRDFLNGEASLQTLSMMMDLDESGDEVVIKSEKAFENISFAGAEPADCEVSYHDCVKRDMELLKKYCDDSLRAGILNEIYISDIMNGEVSDDELRI